VCFSLRLKVSMVGDKRISRSIEFQITGATERKNKRQSSCWMEQGQESAGQRREGNEQADDNECEKNDIEESWYRGLNMLWWQARNEYCCKQVASEVAWSGLCCQTVEQF